MSDYKIPERIGLYLRTYTEGDSTKPFLRLDFDRGSEAIYIYFISSISPSDERIHEIRRRTQNAIDDLVPQLDTMKGLWDNYKEMDGKLGFMELMKAIVGASKFFNARRSLKYSCDDLDKLAALHSGSGLRIDVNYQIGVRQSKDTPI